MDDDIINFLVASAREMLKKAAELANKNYSPWIDWDEIGREVAAYAEIGWQSSSYDC